MPRKCKYERLYADRKQTDIWVGKGTAVKGRRDLVGVMKMF
jgi:hypothetical protein